MSIVLFDNHNRNSLSPVTTTRAVAGIRMGILTIQERWELLSGQRSFIATLPYLSSLYPAIEPGIHLWIDASVIPHPGLVEKILQLAPGEALFDNEGLIAGITDERDLPTIEKKKSIFDKITDIADCPRLTFPWEIAGRWNAAMLQTDFELLTKGRISANIPPHCQAFSPENIFIEEGAVIEHAILNASEGYIYIGKDARIMDGAIIRGPVAVCQKAVIKMGAKIYGATTIGPHCIAGGEIKNIVMQAYSNKAHDGYLGDSYIGEWCNLGAGTSCSNVKNTGANILMWSDHYQQHIDAGKKCGVIMGDYSRTAINTSLNTGTITGICCNIFGSGLMPKIIPDFFWGGQDSERYRLDKVLVDIDNWKIMKHLALKQEEKNILSHIFEQFLK